MPTTRKNLEQPLGPEDVPARFRGDLMRRGVVQDNGELSNDATAGLFLDALMQSLSGMSCLIETNKQSAAMFVDADSRLDEFICMSDQMRGLIFRAYARRIMDLMLTRGADDLPCPRADMGDRLN